MFLPRGRSRWRLEFFEISVSSISGMIVFVIAVKVAVYLAAVIPGKLDKPGIFWPLLCEGRRE